tara:strand:+ start:1838 stop:1951 length:114 start_codon:yes stop_codon:yes gene_type:complete
MNIAIQIVFALGSLCLVSLGLRELMKEFSVVYKRKVG